MFSKTIELSELLFFCLFCFFICLFGEGGGHSQGYGSGWVLMSLPLPHFQNVVHIPHSWLSLMHWHTLFPSQRPSSTAGSFGADRGHPVESVDELLASIAFLHFLAVENVIRLDSAHRVFRRVLRFRRLRFHHRRHHRHRRRSYDARRMHIRLQSFDPSLWNFLELSGIF